MTDNHGATSTASLKVVVGSLPPVATLDLPASGATFTVGQTATYHGSATDPDDGPLPSTALHWTVLLLHHNTHIHPFIETTGSGDSFPVDNRDPSSTWSFEFLLTATDSSGLTDTKSITVPVNPPPHSAPVLLYGMNEGTGTTMTDTSGNNHMGSLLNGPVRVAGQATYGQALSFEGVNNAVSVANPAGFNFGTADFTIELWAKRNVLGGAQRHLFSKCHSTLWQSGCKEFYFNANNQLTFGSFATGDTFAGTIADTSWHHVAVTFTDSTNTLKIYVDGVLVTTATKALEADNAAHVVTLGNLQGTNTFRGLLDEVRIYSRALTQGEIHTDMTTPIGPRGRTPTVER